MEEFPSNPLAAQLMRKLALEGQEQFVRAGLKHMSEPEQNSAHQMLGLLLLRQDSLLDRIANPQANTRAGAVSLFRRFLVMESSFDVRMARRLPSRGTSCGQLGSFDGPRSARALDILDDVSEGRRLLPILGHLPDSHEPRISSRATLFIGKRVRSAEWTARQLGRADPRVRANAVEALWGVKTEPVLALFRECVLDKQNRVAGNGLVGLHIGGQQDATGRIVDMSRDDEPGRRLTAAWAMGRLAADSFAARLTEMIRDGDSDVRGMALKALMLIRKTSPAAIQPNDRQPETIPGTAQATEEAKAAEDPIVAIDMRLDGQTFRAG
jgi:hypothetical protein